MKLKERVGEFIFGFDFSTVKVPSQAIGEMEPQKIDQTVKITLDGVKDQANRVDTWGIEVVKHLVIINAAGLAGTFTLYQVQGIERSFFPTVLFLTGLTSSFVSLMLSWHLHRKIFFSIFRGFFQFLAGTANSDFASRPAIDFRSWAGAVTITALAAGLLFLAGAVDLYVLVRASGSPIDVDRTSDALAESTCKGTWPQPSYSSCPFRLPGNVP
ncbi:hypothetical protein [Paraburkholderia caledonica]|uniref:hypothetical protein n=1 Tax=Paraburkholderia caledonica TaxID=134536 RepID=UPI0003677D24|nr:hypothetical protein [Paraburkholderia caledonica]